MSDGADRIGSHDDAHFSFDDRLEFTAGCRSCQWSAGIRRYTYMQARLGRDGGTFGHSIRKGLRKG